MSDATALAEPWRLLAPCAMLRLLWCVVRSSAARAVGAAVELVEALSFRVPLPCPVADDHQRLLTGLAEVFDREP